MPNLPDGNSASRPRRRFALQVTRRGAPNHYQQNAVTPARVDVKTATWLPTSGSSTHSQPSNSTKFPASHSTRCIFPRGLPFGEADRRIPQGTNKQSSEQAAGGATTGPRTGRRSGKARAHAVTEVWLEARSVGHYDHGRARVGCHSA
jgi:hypothetical protein